MENFGLRDNYNGEDNNDDNDVIFVSPVVILPGPVSGSQTAVKRRNEEMILIAKSKFFGG